VGPRSSGPPVGRFGCTEVGLALADADRSHRLCGAGLASDRAVPYLCASLASPLLSSSALASFASPPAASPSSPVSPLILPVLCRSKARREEGEGVVPCKALQQREVRGAASSPPCLGTCLSSPLSLRLVEGFFRERKLLIGVCSSIGAFA